MKHDSELETKLVFNSTSCATLPEFEATQIGLVFCFSNALLLSDLLLILELLHLALATNCSCRARFIFLSAVFAESH